MNEYSWGLEDEYLAHHGIKGMKWGVRRYQNKDGSYTDAGKKHVMSYKEYKKKAMSAGYEQHKADKWRNYGYSFKAAQKDAQKRSDKLGGETSTKARRAGYALSKRNGAMMVGAATSAYRSYGNNKYKAGIAAQAANRKSDSARVANAAGWTYLIGSEALSAAAGAASSYIIGDIASLGSYTRGEITMRHEYNKYKKQKLSEV